MDQTFCHSPVTSSQDTSLLHNQSTSDVQEQRRATTTDFVTWPKTNKRGKKKKPPSWSILNASHSEFEPLPLFCGAVFCHFNLLFSLFTGTLPWTFGTVRRFWGLNSHALGSLWDSGFSLGLVCTAPCPVQQCSWLLSQWTAKAPAPITRWIRRLQVHLQLGRTLLPFLQWSGRNLQRDTRRALVQCVPLDDPRRELRHSW